MSNRQFAVAEILSAAGGSWTRSRQDVTAVLIPAVRLNLPNLLRYALSAGADITLTDSSARMPLHHAVLGMHHPLLQCLINPITVAHADRFGNTPLHLAAMASNPFAVKTLLERQVPLNARNRDGNTALSCACSFPCANTAMLLLRAGADTGQANYFGQYPLHIACLHGQTEIVRMLLAYNVDLHVRTAYGESAVDIAQRGNVAAITTALTLGGARS